MPEMPADSARKIEHSRAEEAPSGKDLAALLDTFFAQAAEGQRALDAGAPSTAAAAYDAAITALTAAIPLQDQASGDPRHVALLRAKHEEYTSIRRSLHADIASQRAERDPSPEEAPPPDRAPAAAPAPPEAAAAGPSAPPAEPADPTEAAAREAVLRALSLDEAKREDAALPLYIQAAELYLAALDAARAAAEARAGRPREAALRAQLAQVMDRIEAIKASRDPPRSPAAAPAARPHSAPPPGPPGGAAARPGSGPRPPVPAAPPAAPSGAPAGPLLSGTEIAVLRRTSRINGRVFLPWVDGSFLRAERFQYLEPFEDPAGLLALSSKQRRHFGAWRRPAEIVQAGEPVMIAAVSALRITQDLVGDCSFVASLCITAAFEQRFRRRLITGIIYPQDRAGNPVYNPSGKYAVKLWANGCERAVIVDDRLPCDRRGHLMTCYSSDPRELWVSIVEKAYMKLNGGYDFPGSNSGIDLYALTGWIPETVFLEENTPASQPGRSVSSEVAQDGERVWERLRSAHRYGDCLITISTGALEEAEAARAGLVPTHAYAVLDVRQVAAGVASPQPERLLLVKNPWAKVRWRGKFSAEDTKSWTPALQQALGYDPAAAARKDDGLFWIDYRSAQHYFELAHLNWNPGLFRHRAQVHAHWPRSQGPDNASFNLGYNPQYSLTVDPPIAAAAAGGGKGGGGAVASVWVLLTRHVTEKDAEPDPEAHDARGGGGGRGLGGGAGRGGPRAAEAGPGALARESADYVTVHLFDGNQGQRVFSPSEGCMVRGVHTNNPHSLTRFDVPLPASSAGRRRRYTVVVSQASKHRDVSFSLSVLSTTAAVALVPAPPLPPCLAELRGRWEPPSAGGPPGSPRFFCNPTWTLQVERGCRVHAELVAPKGTFVGLHLVRGAGGGRVDAIAPRSSEAGPGPAEAASSGPYMSGFCHLAVPALQAGTYTLVASTFEPGQVADFVLKVFTSAPLGGGGPRAVPPEGQGMAARCLAGRWSAAAATAAGSPNHRNFAANPTFRVVVGARSTLLARLTLTGAAPGASRVGLSLALFPAAAPSSSREQVGLPAGASPIDLKGSREGATCLAASNGGNYVAAPCGAKLGPLALDPGTYLVVPSTFDPWEGAFSLVLYTHPEGALVSQIR